MRLLFVAMLLMAVPLVGCFGGDDGSVPTLPSAATPATGTPASAAGTSSPEAQAPEATTTTPAPAGSPSQSASTEEPNAAESDPNEGAPASESSEQAAPSSADVAEPTPTVAPTPTPTPSPAPSPTPNLTPTPTPPPSPKTLFSESHDYSQQTAASDPLAHTASLGSGFTKLRITVDLVPLTAATSPPGAPVTAGSLGIASTVTPPGIHENATVTLSHSGGSTYVCAPLDPALLPEAERCEVFPTKAPAGTWTLTYRGFGNVIATVNVTAT